MVYLRTHVLKCDQKYVTYVQKTNVLIVMFGLIIVYDWVYCLLSGGNYRVLYS